MTIFKIADANGGSVYVICGYSVFRQVKKFFPQNSPPRVILDGESEFSVKIYLTNVVLSKSQNYGFLTHFDDFFDSISKMQMTNPPRRDTFRGYKQKLILHFSGEHVREI